MQYRTLLFNPNSVVSMHSFWVCTGRWRREGLSRSVSAGAAAPPSSWAARRTQPSLGRKIRLVELELQKVGKRHNFELVNFWKPEANEDLRRVKLIYEPAIKQRVDS